MQESSGANLVFCYIKLCHHQDTYGGNRNLPSLLDLLRNHCLLYLKCVKNKIGTLPPTLLELQRSGDARKANPDNTWFCKKSNR